MRAFPVMLPSSVRYWTVVDVEYRVVGAADGYLQHLRLGQDAAESTTKAYAEALALYLRWCERTSRDWRTAAGRLGGFITWLRHTPGDPDAPASGPGLRDVRGAARINRILAVVRGFIRHQVAIGDGRVTGFRRPRGWLIVPQMPRCWPCWGRAGRRGTGSW
jgi:hypothetical protein